MGPLIQIAPFLIWLLCIGIAAIIVGLFLRTIDKEGFTDISASPSKVQGGIRITVCPSGSVSYVTQDGYTNCCDGDIVNGRCNGVNMCSLSNSVENGVQSCSDWLRKEWAARSLKFCAPSIPNYFGTMNRDPKTEGCSASPCTEDGTAPQDITRGQCKIYGNMTDELAKIDSCYNIAAKDRLVCPQANASKEITPSKGQNGEPLPALLKCTYTPANGSSQNIPVHCIDVPRFATYIGSSQKDPKMVGVISALLESFGAMDVNFCPASKAYFVDGTLKREKATGLPGPPSCPTK